MYDLIPFSKHSLALQVRADFRRLGASLMELRFEVADPVGLVLDRPTAAHYERADLKRVDGLWKTTCFEAFWGEPGQPGYYELNLSANSGRWNLYQFDSYRQPQPPTPSNDFELEDLLVSAQSLIARLRGESAKIEASLCAVLRTSEGPLYYATRHAGEKPDFHLRQSFVIQL
jgi:hypothetical protein